MQDIKRLENKYLRAKIEYYEGNPIMSDAEFDSLEQMLIKEGSKVHEQVGSKRKDFDFLHPTKMLSLSKLQTEKGDLMFTEFRNWYIKRAAVAGKDYPPSASPKFDGSAINIIYRDGKLENILTRGDGLSGKNITKRLAPHVPKVLDAKGILEIRCEVVIDTNVFEKKYATEFANARNFVAGVLGKDDFDKTKISDLTLIPLHFITNGEHQSQKDFILYSGISETEYPDFCKEWNKPFVYTGYEDVMKEFEEMRKNINFQLDGVVISFPEAVRKDLGENDHDPEWSIAIKFVPEGAVTTVKDLEWNIGKRGQFTPVILLKPVQLAGTTVKRASGYNAGFLRDNGIGPGSIVSVEKAGDIIPEIVNVISEHYEEFSLPENCPGCGIKLNFDGIHLTCPNQICPGRIAKILAHGSGVLDLKGIGSERLKPFAKTFTNIYNIWIYVLKTCEDKKDNPLGNWGLKPGTRLNEIFIDAFMNIKSIPYEKVIQLLGIENVGKKISIQIAKEHAGLEPNYSGLEKVLVEKLRSDEYEKWIKKSVCELEKFGVVVDKPNDFKGRQSLGIVMTGSPKKFGFKTKAEFLAKFPDFVECSMSDSFCKYLITDDLNSTSGKMKQAMKKNIEIKTYGDF